MREFQIHYERMIEYYRDQFKEHFTPELMKALNLKKTLVDELIERRLLLQEARRLGFEVTDGELMDSLSAVPEFQSAGRFDRERYRQFLRSKRMSAAEFETEQKKQLAIGKLFSLVLGAAHVAENEIRDRYRVQQEKINLYFIRLPQDSFLPEVKITAEEISKAYDQNKEAFREPPRIQVEYLAYPYALFAAKTQVSKEEIENFYKTHGQTRFQQPMAIRARHILFRVPAEESAQQKGQIRAKAETVLQQARSGGDFARLAKEYSDDPSSAQGGEVGWLAKGQMIPALEEPAFALKPGEISGVLQSTEGYHILKVEERREAKSASLQEATEEIVKALITEKAKTEALRAADADREKILAGSDSSRLAKDRGVPMAVSSLFSRADTLPEIGAVEEFYKAAFALSGNEISRPVEGPVAYYLVRVRERKESFIPPFETVRSRLEKNLQDRKALEAATQKAETLLVELQKEKEIRTLAQRNSLKVEETGFFPRSASEIPKIGTLREVKGGALPLSTYRPVPDRVYTQQQGVYLVAFKEAQEADMAQFEKEKIRLREQALSEKKQRVVQRLIEGLKSKARIIPNPRFLEQS
jgi:peptidyl-prolyl cis-trans isomerase D